MRKIATTTELRSKLRTILAYAQSDRPSRRAIASALSDLSASVAGTVRTSAAYDQYKDYNECRADAQKEANKTGYDYGLELNKLFKTYSYKRLPAKKNRYGHELRMEVVMCENIAKCQPGHGPEA